MRILSTGYTPNESVQDAQAWLERISFYTGILEVLAQSHEVVSMEHIGFETRLHRNGVEYWFQPLRSWRRWLPFKKHQAIRNWKPDLVLVNGFGYSLAMIQLRAWLGHRTKIYLWHRADKPPSGPRRWLQRRADRVVDGYFFTSPGNAEPWLESGCIADAGKVHCLLQSSSSFQPGNQQQAKATLGLGEGPVFIWVGRADFNKDPMTLLQAFSSLLQQKPSASLLFICGDGPVQTEVQDFLDKEPILRAATTYVKNLPHAGLETWFQASDYVISTSFSEGSGISVIEALSCGCSPITSRIPSLEAVTSGVGLTFPPGDAGALASCLIQCSEPLLSHKRAAVIAHFHQTLSFESIACKLASITGLR
jgi:glycosyltransferase involved in cell wall biosynthesis